MKIAAAYIRVSTEEQSEYSPLAQLNLIKKYAKENDLKIPKEYIFIDEGYSARQVEKRPAFMKMISVAKNKPVPFNFILVHKFDRFSRNREDSVVYKSLLKKEYNIKVISITESIEDDKFSLILESMLEAMAEYYSLNLAEEVKKGMTEKAKKGEYQAYAPLGFINDKKNKTLIINDEEAIIIKYIFNEFLNGTPIQKIVKNLKILGFKTKRGNFFERRAVEYILKNTVYKGYTTWCFEGKRTRDYKKKSYIVKGNYPAIINEEIFDKVQIKLKDNKEKYFKNKIDYKFEKHYLSGIIKCSNCGSSLSIGKKYCQCISYSRGKCDVSNYLLTKDIEKAFLMQINELENILFKNNIVFNIDSIKKENFDEEIKIINLEMDRLNTQLKRTKEAYLNKIDTIQEYKENKINIESKIFELNNKLNEIKSRLKIEIDDFNLKTKSITSFLQDKEISNFDKNEFIKNIVKKVIFNKNSRTLEFYYYN